LEVYLPPAALGELFPFHFAFDRSGTIREVGPALRRICPPVAPGARMGDVLHLLRPAPPLLFESLLRQPRMLVVFETVAKRLKLRGQVWLDAETGVILFLGTPWITDLRELRGHGITLEDLPPHSSQAETLFLLRANQVAAEDARSLSRRLERQQAELDAANASLRGVLETAAEGIITMGPDGKVRSFNGAAERIFGYAAEEVVGHDVTMLMPPATGRMHSSYVERYMQTGEGSVVGGSREVEGRHRDGRPLALELSVSDASIGVPRLFTGIVRDLADRKRFERNQAAQVAVAGVLLSAHSVSELVSRVAEPLATTLGFEALVLWLAPDAGGALAFSKLWTAHPDRCGAFADAVRGVMLVTGQGLTGRAFATGQAMVLEDTAEEGGAHYHGAAALCGLRSAVAFPIYGEEAAHGVVELLLAEPLPTDVTLLRTLESIGRHMGLAVERVRALRLAEESSRAKEQFLAHMSHEIRTPLSAVIGLAYLLGKTSLDKRQEDILARIRSSAEVLLGLINGVLDFTKLAAGQMTLSEQECDLALLVRDLAASQEALARERGLSLAVDVDPALPGMVLADPVRLTQVLLNLLNNAIKFTAHGGVTARVALVAEAADGAEVRFSIADTGAGIEAADRERIFEPFAQAQPKGARHGSGTGLGLAIVRQLVGLQGGTLSLDSAPGIGSTFHVTLPFRVVQRGISPLAETKRGSALGGLRILVADDSETNRFVASEILGAAGAEIVMAQDGAEAVARVRESRFDLVLMDLQMPGLDGYQALEQIRREAGPSQAPPVAALTAWATQEERLRVEAAGMVDMILKPFRPEALIERVALLAQGRAPGTASDSPVVASLAPPLIDRAVLLDQSLGQGDFAREILALFRREGAELLDRMEQALAGGNVAALRPLAHRLKSQAGTAGATALMISMDQLEAGVQDGLSGDHSALANHATAAVALGRAVLEEAARLESDLVGKEG